MIPPSVRGLFQFDVVLMLSIFSFDFNAIKKWRVNICVTFIYKYSTTVFFCLCVLEKASFRNYNKAGVRARANFRVRTEKGKKC